MENKWKLTSDFIDDKKVYRVYRLKDENGVDHSGNREYATDYLDDKAVAEKAADLLAETAAKRALPEKKKEEK
jgi:hypothetical protein